MVAEAGALRTNTGNDYRNDSGSPECGAVDTGEFGVRRISAVLVAMSRHFRYRYGHDVPARQPIVPAMLTRLLILMLLFMMPWCDDSAAAPPVTMKVGECTGNDGPIGPDTIFGCNVAVEPSGVAATVYAFSSCAVSAGPQTIEGKARLMFRTTPKAPPGRCSVTLFTSSDATHSIETSTEATVEVVGSSMAKSANEEADGQPKR